MILDTGTNMVHIFNDYTMMHNLRRAPSTLKLIFGGSEGVPEVVGDVTIVTDEGSLLTLTDVAYWPQCPTNLVCYNRTYEAGYTNLAPASITDPWTFSKDGRVVFSAHLHPSKFWVLNARALRRGVAADEALAESAGTSIGALIVGARRTIKTTPDMLHRSFAHLGGGSNGALARAIAGDMLTGVPVSIKDFKMAAADASCTSCITGKHTRLPFKSSGNSAEHPAQLIHTDIQGPMEKSFEGYRYWISFLDDYSGLVAVRLLRKRSEAPDCVRAVIPLMERMGGFPTAVLQSDNGGEYFASELESWFQEQGIRHQSSTAYTPEQNGKAERLNRTIHNSVRAMLADSHLPNKETFWDEAISCAVEALNRLPKTGAPATPWEMFTGSKPDASYLRPFGAACYVHVPEI